MTMNTDPPNKKLKTDVVRLTHPVAVLDDQYYRDVELVEVYVTRVTDKNRIGSVVQQLKTIYPLPDTLSHLKRVKGDEIILALVETIAKSECTEVVLNQLQGVQPVVGVSKVPRESPKTKQQHTQANDLWPCNFHPSKMIENLLAQKYFTDDEVTRLYEYMRLALYTAQEKGSSSVAVVVNPQKNEVMAVASDDRSQNPSSHAVMAALEEVAEKQRILFKNYNENGKDQHMMNISTLPGENDAGKISHELPYLCTGYDVFVTREPCIMCAMAMVHSRVKRVFYGCATKNGALGTKCKVHTRPSLNHHYLVFKNILADECSKLQEKCEKIG